MKKILLMAAVAMMTAMSAMAQRIEVVDAGGQGIPLVSVLTEDGTYIGTTGLDGVLSDVKGAKKVALTHVAYKPQLVTVSSLQGGRITLEDIGYDLDEIVVKPKPYIYVEVFYRVYVYRNDSLCYFLSGIMPNAYDIQKKKIEYGSYEQARSEFCEKMGAAITWGIRAQEYHAGIASAQNLQNLEKKMKDKYFVTATADNPNHTTYSNPEGVIGQLVRTGGQARITLDAAKMQMYVNKAKGETKMLKKREEKGYKYQFTTVLDDDAEPGHAVENYMMDLNHWEYNDKKGHVKFFVESYATDHYYMDKQEWKDKKKEIKKDYKSATLESMESYATAHGVPALSASVRQTIKKLKPW